MLLCSGGSSDHNETTVYHREFIQDALPVSVCFLVHLYDNQPVLTYFRYRCSEAIEAFKKLPQNQYKTSWVLCQVIIIFIFICIFIFFFSL